jgi:Fur family ferric uptake transcriptional regulator
VYEHPHSDTDSIIRAVREQAGDVSHQAVYDVLAALTGTGLLRRIQPMGSLARYEARIGDNHHHAVCRTCGSIADVDCAVGDIPCLTPSDDAGYEIGEAEVIYWGRCPACVAEDDPARRDAHTRLKAAGQDGGGRREVPITSDALGIPSETGDTPT